MLRGQTIRSEYGALAGLTVVTVVLVASVVWLVRGSAKSRGGTDVGSRDGIHERQQQVFTYPQIDPLPNFTLSSTKPRRYRPFKWGPKFHVNMGIRPMEWNEWIQIDDRFAEYHAIRTHRVRERGPAVVRILEETNGIPSGLAAAQEAAQEMAEFLSRRYPQIYHVTRSPASRKQLGWDGLGPITSIEIPPLGVRYDLQKDDAMTICASLSQDDIALLNKGPDGRYYLTAGAVCLAGTWRLADKIGLPLDEIHTSGDVPHYQLKLQESMNRYFIKLQPNKPIARNNYTFHIIGNQLGLMSEIDPLELAWNRSVCGDEDNRDERGHHEGLPKSPLADLTISAIYLRVEQQTLRRLPRSDAIMFGIRTYLTPITELAEEPGVPGRLASAVRSWSPEVAEYKSLKKYEHILLPFLDGKHAEQLENGKWNEKMGEGERSFPF